MSNWRRTAAKLAIESRYRPDENHDDLRRQFREEKLAEHIKKVVDQAPPLTPEQRDRLAVLLRAPRKGAAASADAA